MPPQFNVPTKQLSDDPLVLIQSASDGIRNIDKNDFKNQVEEKVIAPLKKAVSILKASKDKEKRRLALQISYRANFLRTQLESADETKEQNKILYAISYRLNHWKVELGQLGQQTTDESGFFVADEKLEDFVNNYAGFLFNSGKNTKNWYGYSTGDTKPAWYSSIEADLTHLEAMYGDDLLQLSKDLQNKAMELYPNHTYRHVLLSQLGNLDNFRAGLVKLALTQQAIDGLSISLKAKQLGRKTSFSELEPFFSYFLTVKAEDNKRVLSKRQIKVLAGEISGDFNSIVSRVFNYLNSSGHDGLVSLVIDSNYGTNTTILDNLLEDLNPSYNTSAQSSSDKLVHLYSLCWNTLGKYSKVWDRFQNRYSSTVDELLTENEYISSDAIAVQLSSLETQNDQQKLSFEVDTYSFVDILNIMYGIENGGEFINSLSDVETTETLSRVNAKEFFDVIHKNSQTFGVIMQSSDKMDEIYFGLGQESVEHTRQFMEVSKRIAERTYNILTRSDFERVGKNRTDMAYDFIDAIITANAPGLNNLNNMVLVRDEQDKVVGIKDPTNNLFVVTREGVQQVWDLRQLRHMNLITKDSDELSVEEWSGRLREFLTSTQKFIGDMHISDVSPNLRFQLDYRNILTEIDRAYSDIARYVEGFELYSGDADLKYSFVKIDKNLLDMLGGVSLYGPTGESVVYNSNVFSSQQFDEDGNPIKRDIDELHELLVNNLNTVLPNFTNELNELAVRYLRKAGTVDLVSFDEETQTTKTEDGEYSSIQKDVHLQNKTGKVFVYLTGLAHTHLSDGVETTTVGQPPTLETEATKHFDAKDLRADIVVSIEGNYYKVVLNEQKEKDTEFMKSVQNLIQTNSSKLNYVFSQVRYAEFYHSFSPNFTLESGLTHGRSQELKFENEIQKFDDIKKRVNGIGFFVGSEVRFKKIDFSTLDIQTPGKNWAGTVEFDFSKKGKDPQQSLILGVFDLRWPEPDIYGNEVEKNYGYNLASGTRLGLISYRIIDQLNLLGAFGGNKETLLGGMRLDMPNVSGGLVVRLDKNEDQKYEVSDGILTGKLTTEKLDIVGYSEFETGQKSDYGINAIYKIADDERIMVHLSVPQPFRELDEISVKNIKTTLLDLVEEIDEKTPNWEELTYQQKQTLVESWRNGLQNIRKRIVSFSPGQDLPAVDTHISVSYQKGDFIAGVSRIEDEKTGEYIIGSTNFDVDNNVNASVILGREISGMKPSEDFGGLKLKFKKGLFDKESVFSFGLTERSKQFTYVQQLTGDLYLATNLKAINDLYKGTKIEIGKENKFAANFQYGAGDNLKLFGVGLSLKDIIDLGDTNLFNIGYTNTKSSDVTSNRITGSFDVRTGRIGFNVFGDLNIGNFNGKNKTRLDNLGVKFYFLFPSKK